MLTKGSLKIGVVWISGFALASLILCTSPSFQACVYQHQNHASDGTAQENISRFLIFYEAVRGCGGAWLHRHGDGIIALFTVILGVATWLLWRSTKSLVDGAESTAERQLRAYIHVEDAQIIHANDEWRPNIRISIKNYGQTPARQVRHKIGNALVMRGPGAFDLSPDDAVCDLGPSQGFTKTFHSNREFWNTMTKPAIIGKTGTYFVFGEITYFDVFKPGEVRTTKYRFEVRADGEGVTDGGLFFSKEGNHSD